MIAVRRWCAAILAVVLVLLPAALDTCRTACAHGARDELTAKSPAGGCHELAAGATASTRIDGQPRACDHDDYGRTGESIVTSRGTLRTDVSAAVAGSLFHMTVPASGAGIVGPPGFVASPRASLAVNAPLRL